MPKTPRQAHQPASRREEMTATEIRLLLLLQRMHEQEKDALMACEMLEASASRFAGGVTRHYQKIIAERDAAIREEIEKATQIIKNRADAFTADIEKSFNELVGVEDSEALIRKMAEFVSLNMGPVIRESVTEIIQGLFDGGALLKLIRKEARDVIFEILIPQRSLSAADLSVYALQNITSDDDMNRIARTIAGMAKREQEEPDSSS